MLDKLRELANDVENLAVSIGDMSNQYHEGQPEYYLYRNNEERLYKMLKEILQQLELHEKSKLSLSKRD